jgi:hypothetical protein
LITKKLRGLSKASGRSDAEAVPLVFSPLSEDVLGPAPIRLYPRSAFVMRQLGATPDIDQQMFDTINTIFSDDGIEVLDASSTSGRKDYLERILGLIRGTGFTVALFSEETRQTAFANIALELGFAAMCGKPIVIVKSKNAEAPSDLTRTDWVEYDPDDPEPFAVKLAQAIGEINSLAEFEGDTLEVALEAGRMDCAVAFERAKKAFLLTGDQVFIVHAETILGRLKDVKEGSGIDDLHRERNEVRTFIRQANRSLGN